MSRLPWGKSLHLPWLMRRVAVFLTTYYAYMVEYRAELLLWVLSGILPFILMGVWIQAGASGQFALSPLQFSRYFLAAFIARQFNIVWVIWDFEREVVQGTLSPRLLQPLDPVWHHVASHLAERLARLPFSLLLVGGFFLLYPQAFWLPSPTSFLLFCLAAFTSFTLRFLIQYTFALFAFWLEKASAIEETWFLLYLFLSGLIAPLEVFPPIVRDVISWTPFPYMVHFPAALLVGLPVNLGRGFLVMVVWGVVFWIGNRWLWRQGLKKYSSMGA